MIGKNDIQNQHYNDNKSFNSYGEFFAKNNPNSATSPYSGYPSPPNNPYQANQYSQNPNNQNPYGQNPYPEYGVNPYGQNQYGQNQYNQNQYGQNQYGQNQYNQNQYGQNPPMNPNTTNYDNYGNKQNYAYDSNSMLATQQKSTCGCGQCCVACLACGACLTCVSCLQICTLCNP